MSRTTRGLDRAPQVSRRRWLIDGMNVIGSRPNRWWNDPDRAVRDLIEELDRYAASTDEDVTVVFDRGPSGHTPEIHSTVNVVFASWRGPNAADHEIVRIVAADPTSNCIRVVTSDRRLGERVRELGAAVTSSTRFRRRLTETLG